MQDAIKTILGLMDCFPQWTKTDIIDYDCIRIHYETDDHYTSDFENAIELLEWCEEKLEQKINREAEN